MKKIPPKLITLWTQQLSILLQAHLPLLQALQLLNTAQTHNEIQKFTQHIILEIKQGLPLSQALKKFPNYFDQSYCQLIVAAEQSGTLTLILQRIAEQRILRHKIRAQLIKALIYPLLVLCVGGIVFILLLMFVVPQMAKVFTEQQTLPAFTQFILTIASFLQNYGIYLFGFILFICGAITLAHQHLPNVAFSLAQYQWKCKGIGSLLQQAGCVLFARTLATLLDAGIPLLTSLPISLQVIPNLYVQQRLQAATIIIAQGHSLSYALNQAQLFPHLAQQMWQIGEHTGKLSLLLNDSATYYQQQLDHLTEHIAQLIEPVLLIVLGLMIGSVVIAMYLPLFRLGLVLGA